MSEVKTLGKYEIRRQLGRGAMGVVYEGWDPVIERRVAIKTVHLPDADDDETAEEIARFRREAQAAGRLTHPNIVGVFDYGETSDVAYIVMEYVDGPPLKDLLDEKKQLPLERIVAIMRDLLAGLQFSHERGVVHRDIKPANLMLTSGGQAKIADFGIARIESSSMTQLGTVMGTPAFMSPEQFLGSGVTSRSDIYSSGVLLYQMLAGERPFKGNFSTIQQLALNTEPQWPSERSPAAPPAFDAVVKRAMARKPEDRFATAAEFALAIRAAAASSGTAVESTGDTIRAAPERKPSSQPAAAPIAARKSALPMILGGGAAAVAVLGGLGYFLLGGGGSSSGPERKAADATSVNPADTDRIAAERAAADRAAAERQAAADRAAAERAGNDRTASDRAAADRATGDRAAADQAAAEKAVADRAATERMAADRATAERAAAAEAMRAQVGALVTNLPCSAMDGDMRDGTARINGVAAKPAIDELRQKLTGLGVRQQAQVLRVSQVDPVFCDLMNVLRPVTGPFGDGTAHLSLRLADDPVYLKKGDHIRPRVAMGDFRGEIHVDYVMRDGNVMHLYPQAADPKEMLTADPPRVLEPGEALALGEKIPGHRPWEADEPFGIDMIIAVASQDRLFDRDRSAMIEPAGPYLRSLKDAIEGARGRSARIAAAAIPIETRKK